MSPVSTGQARVCRSRAPRATHRMQPDNVQPAVLRQPGPQGDGGGLQGAGGDNHRVLSDRPGPPHARPHAREVRDHQGRQDGRDRARRPRSPAVRGREARGAARQEHGAGLPELGRLPWGGAARGVPQRGAGPRQRRGPRVEALARGGRGPRCRCPEHEHFGEAAVAPGPLCGVYLLVDAELQGLGGL